MSILIFNLLKYFPTPQNKSDHDLELIKKTITELPAKSYDFLLLVEENSSRMSLLDS